MAAAAPRDAAPRRSRCTRGAAAAARSPPAAGRPRARGIRPTPRRSRRARRAAPRSGVERPRPDRSGSSVTHRMDMIPLHFRPTMRSAAAIVALDAADRGLERLSRSRSRRAGRVRVVERIGVAMGSELRLTSLDRRRGGGARGVRCGVRRVRAARSVDEHLASRQRRRPHQCRGRRAGGAVAPDVRDVLRQARQISEWTDGTFDVTFGALTDVWKFDHDQDDSIPGPEAIRARLPFIDYRQIEIDDRAGTVFLKRQGDEDSSRRHRQGVRRRPRGAASCAKPGCAIS